MSYVAVCIPCIDKPHLHTMRCFGNMYYHLGRKGFGVITITTTSSIIVNARNNCIREIERLEATADIAVDWIFFLDSDITFPDQGLTWLLSQSSGRDILGCTYVRRSPPYDVHGKGLSGQAEVVDGLGIIEVAALPTGFLLISRKVFHHLRRPFFRHPIREESSPDAKDDITFGEDYYFCQSVRAAGFKVWLDTELSKQIGHVSEKVLYPDEPTWPMTPEEADTPEGLRSQMLILQDRLAKVTNGRGI